MSEMITVKEFRLKLYPKDFQLVRSFYEQRLGLPVLHEWDRGDQDKGVMFDVGRTVLELLSPEGGYKPIVGCGLSLKVDDAAALWERMKGEHDVPKPLQDSTWGDTFFCIRDPEGFEITFFSDKA